MFGGYDVKKYGKEDSTDSDIQWISIDTENMNYWSLPMGNSKIRLGQNISSIQSSNVILDSGLSFSLIPSSDFKLIESLLKDQYGIFCKADTDES